MLKRFFILEFRSDSKLPDFLTDFGILADLGVTRICRGTALLAAEAAWLIRLLVDWSRTEIHASEEGLIGKRIIVICVLEKY